jgi:hypothetical protein
MLTLKMPLLVETSLALAVFSPEVVPKRTRAVELLAFLEEESSFAGEIRWEVV